MGLALGGAGPDRPPGHGVRDVLRRDRVEPLAAHREPEREHLQQHLASAPQAGVHVAGAVEVGVVDQALPAGGRARLLEVHAHRHAEVGLQPLRLLAQPAGVFERGVGVVHAARTHDHEQAVVLAVEHPADLVAAAQNDVGVLAGHRLLAQDDLGAGQRNGLVDPRVADLVGRPGRASQLF
jgi:hypothetical protein